MKQIYTTLFWTLLLMTLFTSCKPKPLEIDIPEESPKIVVNSFAAEGYIVLYLTKSFSPLADTADQDFVKSLGIAGADAKLIYKGTTISFEELPDSLEANGIYLAQVDNLAPNETITLEASADGLPPIKATTSALPLIEDFDFELVRNPFDSAYATLFYSFNDVNVHAHNYYAIAISGGKEEEIFQGVDTLRDLNTSKYVLFDDLEYPYATIDGAINILADPYDTLNISLAQINQEYYKYLQVSQKAGSFFSSITKEPINYPSNVEGGYGFFNAFLPYFARVVVRE